MWKTPCQFIVRPAVLVALGLLLSACGPTMGEPRTAPDDGSSQVARSEGSVGGDSAPVSLPEISTTVAATGGYALHLDDAPLRIAPNGKANVRLLARGEEAFVAVLSMEARASVPEHQDPTEEYIYVLQGSGTMTMDGETFAVSEGMLVYMPAGATVSFQNGEQPMKALQIFANPDPAAKYDAWTAEEDP